MSKAEPSASPKFFNVVLANASTSVLDSPKATRVLFNDSSKSEAILTEATAAAPIGRVNLVDKEAPV